MKNDETERAVTAPIHDFVAAWANGSGHQMAACFTEDAYFTAFDGTRLKGGAAIGEWHQPAFDTVLKGTKLEIQIDYTQMLAPDLALVATSGGPLGKAGDSRELNLVKRHESGEWKLAALQVTRRRPIHGAKNAILWQVFDAAWTALIR